MSLCLMRNILWLLFALLAYAPLQAQAFQKRYAEPGGRYLIAHDVQENVAGDFLISGEYRDQRAHPFLVKTSAQGLPIWSKIYDTQDTSFYFPAGWNVRPLPNGNALLHTQKSKNGAILGQVLFKISATGEPQWGVYAPSIIDQYSLSLAPGACYLGGYNRPQSKLFLGKLNLDGQSLWQNQYSAGNFDLYRIFCQAPNAGGLVLGVGLEKKQPGGGSFGPNHTMMMQLDEQGNVTNKLFFPHIFIQAIQPLPDGKLAFLARSESIDWVGIGVMDANFNWLWFKDIRLGNKGIVLKDISAGQLSVSGDSEQLTALFYLAGGGRILLRMSPKGQLLAQRVYVTGLFGDALCKAGNLEFIRMANLASDQFLLSRPLPDGSQPSCPTRLACKLQLVDTSFIGEPIETVRTPFACFQVENCLVMPLDILVNDFCYDPGEVDARFTMTDTVICPNETIGVKRLQGVGTYPFGLSSWLFKGAIPNTGSSASVGTIRYEAPGIYPILHKFQVGGCLDSVITYLKVDQPPIVNLGRDSVYCTGIIASMIAGANPDYQYQWSTGDLTSNVNTSIPGAYTVTVSDMAGCFTIDSIAIQFIDPETVALGPDTQACMGQTIRIGPGSGPTNVNMHWNTGQNAPNIAVSTTGTYVLQVENKACIFSDTIAVQFVECPECKVYAPNIFYPESADNNNVFQLFTDCNLTQLSLALYDRWGNQVFEAQSPSEGWDGTYKGRLAQAGVYTYHALLQLESATHPTSQRQLTGQVTLLR